MLIVALLSWWYRQGWVWIAKRMFERIEESADNFSVGILLRTMFSPWKQIVSQTQAQSAIGIKIRAFADNLVSRFVGFMVRLLVLIAAVISIVLLSVIGLLVVAVWPFVPLVSLAFLLLGIGVIEL